jgi:hypothetical protein
MQYGFLAIKFPECNYQAKMPPRHQQAMAAGGYATRRDGGASRKVQGLL